MPKVRKLHTVPHSERNMFELVADVEKYPQFVPLCSSLTIISRKEREGRTLLIANMGVAYKLLRESFTSQVLLDPHQLAIDVKYLDGPFRYLDNQWKFKALDDVSCEVEFSLDYEFKSKMLEMAMGSVFDLAFSKFVSAFENRANEIYGNSSISQP